MTKIQYKLSLLISIIFLLGLISTPERVYAQWPPFSFGLTPLYEGGKITYHIRFSSQVGWAMTGVTIKIPLPDDQR
jgi:hypothetical protein